MGDGRATVFLNFHRTRDAPAFAAFADLVGAHAATAPGFVGWQLSVLTSPLLEWAIAVTFHDEPSLHDWLDGANELLSGRGHLRAGMELFVSGVPRTPGVLLVRDVAEPGREEAFIDTAERFTRLEREFPGYEGTSLFPPADHNRTWSTVIRFRTEDQLNAWQSSPELTRALPERQAQLTQESEITTASSFGSTVRVSDGHAAVTPEWKTAMTIQLALYPLIALLTIFVNPWISVIASQHWLSMFLSMAISVALLTWVVLPLAMRLFRRWLDPVEGASPRVTLIGVAVVCAGYVVFMLIFATVPFLQF